MIIFLFDHRRRMCTKVFLLAIGGFLNSFVHGLPTYVSQLPNGSKISGVKALGHLNPMGGGATNQFGEDFEQNEFQWSAELCLKDSDGDGMTNGEELGDPCCTWTPGTDFQLRNIALSHPGVPNQWQSSDILSRKCKKLSEETQQGILTPEDLISSPESQIQNITPEQATSPDKTKGTEKKESTFSPPFSETTAPSSPASRLTFCKYLAIMSSGLIICQAYILS
jgi:hypothetical protein